MTIRYTEGVGRQPRSIDDRSGDSGARRPRAAPAAVVGLLLLVTACWAYAPGASAAQTLTVMTLNLAHGRGSAFHQALLSTADIRANLTAVAAVLRQSAPDVFALQEADEDAWWSGHLDQAAYLAQRSGFDYRFEGRHMEKFGLNYGTALLSRLPLRAPLSHRFSPSPLTPPKGFVLASVPWPGCPEVEVAVVSVHLDFIRDSVQLRQARELRRAVADRTGPVVLLGDFNTAWEDSDGVLRYLAGSLSLRAYEPSVDLVTLPRFKRRVDWILISDGLQFGDYRVLPATLSDHKPVVAQIGLGPSELRRCAVVDNRADAGAPARESSRPTRH